MKATFLLFFICIFSSSCKQEPCSTKEAFLNHFESLTSDYDVEPTPVDENTRLDYNNRYRSIVNDCYKKYKLEMSLVEKQDFWKKSIVFYADRVDKNSLTLKLDNNSVDPFNAYISEEMKEVVMESGTAFVNSLKKAIQDELPNLIDSVKNEIDKLGDELKKMLDN